jgi:hypothetical protein
MYTLQIQRIYKRPHFYWLGWVWAGEWCKLYVRNPAMSFCDNSYVSFWCACNIEMLIYLTMSLCVVESQVSHANTMHIALRSFVLSFIRRAGNMGPAAICPHEAQYICDHYYYRPEFDM